jgi:lysophospholipase L1-like esterase
MRYFATMVFSVVLAASAFAGERLVLMDFDDGDASGMRVSESLEGSLKSVLVDADEGGKCLRLTFDRKENAGYAYSRLPLVGELKESAAKYDGISFKLKGDGSRVLGTMEIRTDKYVNIFQAVFSLESTEWTEVTLRWDEFFQMNDGTTDAEINWPELNIVAFGSRAQWASCEFEVDEVALVKAEAHASPKAPDGADRLAASVAKLKSGGDFTIVALGDSITFGAKVPPDRRAAALYHGIVGAGLQSAFPGATVKVINSGVGGDIIGEGIVRIGHQVAGYDGDLVVVLLGANDAIYRFTDRRVRATMTILVDKLLENTNADILLLGPTPIVDRPGTPERYGEIYREIAREKGVAFFSLAEPFSILAEADARRALVDTVHLSEYGHEVAGRAILEYILDPAH